MSQGGLRRVQRRHGRCRVENRGAATKASAAQEPARVRTLRHEVGPCTAGKEPHAASKPPRSCALRWHSSCRAAWKRPVLRCTTAARRQAHPVRSEAREDGSRAAAQRVSTRRHFVRTAQPDRRTLAAAQRLIRRCSTCAFGWQALVTSGREVGARQARPRGLPKRLMDCVVRW
eukprot:7390185-Prymnesium_polylepis.3